MKFIVVLSFKQDRRGTKIYTFIDSFIPRRTGRSFGPQMPHFTSAYTTNSAHRFSSRTDALMWARRTGGTVQEVEA